MSDEPNQTSEATRDNEPIPDKIRQFGPITLWRYNIRKRDNAGDLVLPDRTHGYVESRSAFDTYYETLDSRVADIPSLLQAFKRNPEAIENLELSHVDTSTVEYHGPRDGEFSYEVSHRSPGPFSTGRDIAAFWGRNIFTREMRLTQTQMAIAELWGRNPIQRYMHVASGVWADLGRGEYLGQNIARVHLEDVRRGDVPEGPYTVHAREEEVNDLPSILQERDLFIPYINYDGFMRSDSVLMKTGSPENREMLAGIYFRNSDGQIDHNLTIEGPNFRRSFYIIGDRRMSSGDSLETLPAVAGVSRIYLSSRAIPEPYSPDIGLDSNELNFVALKQDQKQDQSGDMLLFPPELYNMRNEGFFLDYDEKLSDNPLYQKKENYE